MAKYNIPAKPTLYKDVRFRSRLEARWAAFFDMTRRKWGYEPFDANGYIPDFVLYGAKRNAIVEVKPAHLMDLDGRQIQAGLAYANAHDFRFIVLNEVLGSAGPGGWLTGGKFFTWADQKPLDRFTEATLWTDDDGRLDFGAEDDPSNSLDGEHCFPWQNGEFQTAWASAGNLVQWQAR